MTRANAGNHNSIALIAQLAIVFFVFLVIFHANVSVHPRATCGA